jgi:hypothetical protein
MPVAYNRMASRDDSSTETGLFRFPPGIYMAAGSFCLARATTAGLNNAGTLWFFASMILFAFWYHREEYGKAAARVAQLEDHLDTREALARVFMRTRRPKTAKRVRLHRRVAA